VTKDEPAPRPARDPQPGSSGGGYGPPSSQGPQSPHGPPPGYGPQPGYGLQPGYSPPPGYSPRPDYAPRPGYSPPPPHGAAPPYGAPPPRATFPGSGGPLPRYAPPPPDHLAPPPRRRGPIIATVVVVLALIAGGIWGYTQFGGLGGADSPGEAVELLAADLSSSNYLGALSRLHPGEADLLADTGEVLLAELQRLEVIRADADPAAVFSALTVTDLRFDESAREPVRDNVVINKLVAGRITLAQGPSSIPFTDSFRDMAFPGGPPPADAPMTIDIANIAAERGEPVRIASVEVDGEWYVSPFYTAADYALASMDKTWPRTTIEPRGAATAEDALRDTVQATLDADIRRLVELAPPGELSVLHDIGDVLVAAGGTERSGAKLIELATIDTDVRGDTALGIARVVVALPTGDQVTVTRSGDCLDIQGSTGPSTPICVADLLGQADVEVADPTLQRILPRLVTALLDVKIVVVSMDGAYYVSPTRTVVGMGADLLRVLEPGDLAELLRAAN